MRRSHTIIDALIGGYPRGDARPARRLAAAASALALAATGVAATAGAAAAETGAAPGNVTVPPLAFDESSITIAWEKPAGAHEADADTIVDYEVSLDGELLGTASANFAEEYDYLNAWVEKFYDATDAFDHYRINLTSFTATGLEPDHHYSFRVRAVYRSGETSAWSEELLAHTSPMPTIVDAADFGAKYWDSKEPDLVTPGGGASADEFAENTTAIQAAIDATPPGGKVVLRGSGDNAAPKYYVSGSLFLHSDMTFEIEKGASLLGSPVFDHYPRSLLVYPYSQDIRTYGLLNAVSWDLGTLQNIRIVGEGIVDGNGWQDADPMLQQVGPLDPDPRDMEGVVDPTGMDWRLPNYFAGNNRNVTTEGILAADAMNKSASDETPNAGTSQFYNTRPNLTVARGVDHLLYEGLTFRNPAFHGIVNYQSENITSLGTIVTTFNGNNADGIEFGDSLGLQLLNNFYDTGDDAINFAAGQGTVVRNESEDVASGRGRIFNNYVRNSHGGLIAAGSHTGGFIGELVAEDNLHNLNETGGSGVLRLKAGPTTGGGVRDITFRDNALHFASNGPKGIIRVETSYSDSNASTAFGPESELPTAFHDIDVSNISVTGALDGPLIDIGEPGNSALSPRMQLRDFHLDDIRLLELGGAAEAGRIQVAALQDSSFTNITSVNPVEAAFSSTTRNITVESVAGTPDHTPATLDFPADAALTARANGGNKVELSWPAAAGDPTGYQVFVQDDHGRNPALRQSVDGDTTEADFYLAPEAEYTVAVRAETADSYGPLLRTTVRTGTAQHESGTIERPDSEVTMNPSGVSWVGLLWSDTTDATYGIHYYLIEAEGSDGSSHTYRAYYDWDRGTGDARGGYALWGLNDGVSYTATVRAVNWAGDVGEPYDPVSFTTVPATQEGVPGWSTDASVDAAWSGLGEPVRLSWDDAQVTDSSNGETAAFAGFRIMVDGVALQPEEGGLDQANATPTTRGTTFEVPTDTWEPGEMHTISVEAGYDILRYASGAGGLDGSTGFNGTQNTDLPRNQVTFGKWTGSGPSVTLHVTDIAGLEAAIAVAEELDSEDYTAESWADVAAALEDARIVLEDARAGRVDQETVDSAEAALRDAADALVDAGPGDASGDDQGEPGDVDSSAGSSGSSKDAGADGTGVDAAGGADTGADAADSDADLDSAGADATGIGAQADSDGASADGSDVDTMPDTGAPVLPALLLAAGLLFAGALLAHHRSAGSPSDPSR